MYNKIGDDMKKNLIIMSLIGILIFTGCGGAYSNYHVKEENNISVSDEKNKTEKVDITYDEYTKKLENNESFVLLLYQTGCSHCESFEPKLNNIIKEFDLTIYGLNLANLSEKEYAVVKNKTFISGTPTTVFVKDGSVDEKMIGDKDEQDIIDFLVEIGYLEEK